MEPAADTRMPGSAPGQGLAAGVGPLVVIALLAAYALPLFVPPPGQPIVPIAPGAAMLERIFPGVPGSWVVGRLACLVAAGLLLLWLVPPAANPLRDERLQVAVPVGRAPAWRVWVALGLAAAQAIAGLWAHRFDRTAQLVYVACLAVPPLVLVTRQRQRGGAGLPAAAVAALVVVAWLALRGPVMWRSPDAADLADTWVGVRFLRQVTEPDYNLLTDRVMAGAGAYHFIFQGAPLLRAVGIELTGRVAQVAHLVWFPLCGLLVGCVAGRLFGVAAAAVATAAFLFSPYALALVLAPLPFFFFPLVVAGLIALFAAVRLRQSEAALAGLGSVAGIGLTLHTANLVSLAVLVAGLVAALRWPARQKARVVLTALLVFFAGAVTGLSDYPNLRSVMSTYSQGRAQWAGHEMAGFGQISPTLSEYVVEAASPRPWDIVVAAALSPVAMARTPLRKAGDALFDPIGAALAMVGAAMALGALGSGWLARLLLGTLVLAVGPAVLSSQDRISVIRLVAMTVPMALLAAAGWTTLQRWLRLEGRAAATATICATVAVGAGGTIMFDSVIPRLLPASWVSVSLRALGTAAVPGGVLFLDHPRPRGFPYWYLNEFAADLVRQPVSVRAFEGPPPLRAGPNGTEAELIVWNPALEEDARVSRVICEQWPAAAVYVLADRAGFSRAFVARPAGPGWVPALPAQEWTRVGCGARLETEATWAAAVLASAGALEAGGQRGAALEMLRSAARRNFAQTTLFKATARALLAAESVPGLADEAVHWAERACQTTRFADPDALATLAAAYAAARQWGAAAEAAQRGQAAALGLRDTPLAQSLGEMAERYRAATGLPQHDS